MELRQDEYQPLQPLVMPDPLPLSRDSHPLSREPQQSLQSVTSLESLQSVQGATSPVVYTSTPPAMYSVSNGSSMSSPQVNMYGAPAPAIDNTIPSGMYNREAGLQSGGGMLISDSASSSAPNMSQPIKLEQNLYQPPPHNGNELISGASGTPLTPIATNSMNSSTNPMGINTPATGGNLRQPPKHSAAAAASAKSRRKHDRVSYG